MITYPISPEDQEKFSVLLANELIATNNILAIQSIITDPKLCKVKILDYVESPKADPQILRNIAAAIEHSTLLEAIVTNKVTTVETLTDICSNPEKYGGWSHALMNPKATREHAMLMIDLREDDDIFSGAYVVASSDFLDEEIADLLFAKHALKGFDFSVLKNRRKNKQLIEDYNVKRNVISALLENERVPQRWVEEYIPVIEKQEVYDPKNSFAYCIKRNKNFSHLLEKSQT